MLKRVCKEVLNSEVARPPLSYPCASERQAAIQAEGNGRCKKTFPNYDTIHKKVLGRVSLPHGKPDSTNEFNSFFTFS